MVQNITTSIDGEYHDKAKKAGLKWSNCLEYGIRLKLWELGMGEDVLKKNDRLSQKIIDLNDERLKLLDRLALLESSNKTLQAEVYKNETSTGTTQ